jgi:hypothetical protein
MIDRIVKIRRVGKATIGGKSIPPGVDVPNIFFTYSTANAIEIILS